MDSVGPLQDSTESTLLAYLPLSNATRATAGVGLRRMVANNDWEAHTAPNPVGAAETPCINGRVAACEGGGHLGWRWEVPRL